MFAGVVGKFELDAHEAELLVQACRCSYVMAALSKQIGKDGLTMRKTLQDPLRANPLCAELRLQQAMYVKLLKQLGLPQGETGAVDREPARRRRSGGGPGRGGLRSVPGELGGA